MIMSVRRIVVVLVVGLSLSLSLLGLGLAQEPIPIAPGTTHTEIYRPEGPWAIHVVETDLSQQHLELRALLGSGQRIGRGTVAQAATAVRSQDRRPVAAVNGDFFSLADDEYGGIPLGLHIDEGELVTLPDPSRSVLYLLADGTVHVSRFRANAWLHGPSDLLYPVAALNRPPGQSELVLFTPRFGERTRGDEQTTQFALANLSGPVCANARLKATIAAITTGAAQPIPPEGAVLAARGVAAYALRGLKVGDEVELSLTLEPQTATIKEAIGGGPRLVREGRVSVEHLEERFADTFATRRHPRTAAGVSDGALLLVTVDGRQPGYSEGMTLPELAQLLINLGCQEAINLDGGGSTTMMVRDQIVNSPSGGAPRPVANALALFTTAPVGAPIRLSVAPTGVCLMSGQQLALEASGLDTYYNPVPVPRAEVQWQCPSAVGQITEAGLFTAAEVAGPMVGLVAARWKDLTAACVVRIVPAPARLVLVPDQAVVSLGGTQRFIATAYDDEGRPLRVPAEQITWCCEPQDLGGQFPAPGLLRAPSQRGVLRVVARVGGAQGEADVWVGGAPLVLEDFERQNGWNYNCQPSGIPGEVQRADDPVVAGNHCLRLKYDFSAAEATRAAHAELNLPLPTRGLLLLSALGDAQGAWLRARLRDGAGQVFTLDLAERVDWSGEWRALRAPLPEGAVSPLTLESIYLVEYHADRKPAGQLLLDDIAVAPADNAQ